MKFNNMTALRETLERMETRQLDEMLCMELKKDLPDGQLVRLIGSVLKEREKDMVPEIETDVQTAWEQYQQDTKVYRKPRFQSSRLAKVACLILVLLAFLLLMPQEANARQFFQRIITWTEDVFSLVSPGENQGRDAAYEFRTNNPGLQEIYNQVTELGVTTPVVPMWLPEGYELVKCSINSLPTKKCIIAVFSNEFSEIVYQIDIYSGIVTHEYSKRDTTVKEYEINGITYTFFQNHELLVAVWTVENIECSILADCPEDVLIRILESVSIMEE